MTEHCYFAADADPADERHRHSLMEAAQDRVTARYLTELGVKAGWRCLEVGAGSGSVARWLADHVGESGRVLATDLDLQFLDGLEHPNLEARVHDILTDPLDAASYDLVHARAVLLHLARPEQGLARMVEALRPGGRLLIEEPDMGTIAAVDAEHPCAAAFDRAIRRSADFVRSTGMFDSYLGRSVPDHLTAAGLEDVGNEAVTEVVRGGEPWALYVMEGQHRLDPLLLDREIVTTEEIAARDAACTDPTFSFLRGLIVAAWGTKPANAQAATT